MKIKFVDKGYYYFDSIMQDLKELQKARLDNLIFVCGNPAAQVRLNQEDVGIDLSNKNEVKLHLDYDHERLFKSEPFIIDSGVKIKLPKGFFGMVVPRSSLPLKLGIDIANSPGIIDWGYRGEVKMQVEVKNWKLFSENFVLDKYEIRIPKHTRLAQLIILPGIYPCDFSYPSEIIFYICKNEHVFFKFNEIFPSNRGGGGFGSTGV